jgi:hypothetical protein
MKDAKGVPLDVAVVEPLIEGMKPVDLWTNSDQNCFCFPSPHQLADDVVAEHQVCLDVQDQIIHCVEYLCIPQLQDIGYDRDQAHASPPVASSCGLHFFRTFSPKSWKSMLERGY